MITTSGEHTQGPRFKLKHCHKKKKEKEKEKNVWVYI
jgi:hypothetical protein